MASGGFRMEERLKEIRFAMIIHTILLFGMVGMCCMITVGTVNDCQCIDPEGRMKTKLNQGVYIPLDKLYEICSMLVDQSTEWDRGFDCIRCKICGAAGGKNYSTRPDDFRASDLVHMQTCDLNFANGVVSNYLQTVRDMTDGQ
jgi:hypothetical protein